MSTLSSQSTFDAIKAAYMDNASYAEDHSTAKAAMFITACRMLLVKLPARLAGGVQKEEVEWDLPTIQSELRAAERWLALNRFSTFGNRQFGFTHFR